MPLTSGEASLIATGDDALEGVAGIQGELNGEKGDEPRKEGVEEELGEDGRAMFSNDVPLTSPCCSQPEGSDTQRG